MEQREQALRRWFAMWLRQDAAGIEEIFAPDAVYVESWGPEYRGLEKIRHWFWEWNTRGVVERWDIRQFFHRGDQTIVEWTFRNRMLDGRVESFDGLTKTIWNRGGRIVFLQEFGCNQNRYDPYRNGPKPQFRDEAAAWF
ncbi:MAG: nuclear transport factor 2 family protein [Oscillospiraceae bacterium]|nr:nuclear transport factor 2 family protein [Oscillospiraceae bacterium]